MSNGKTQKWDAIVVGSGMGGMTAAAALSKTGHKVLLLEQYTTLGGLTHSFSREGFTWDVGIHYLGCVAPGDRERALIDWLTHTPMAFEPMGAVYDNLHIGNAPPLALSRPFEAQERDLKDRFPDEAEAIEAWIAALREGRDLMYTLAPTRATPEFVGDMIDWWNRRAIDKWCKRTLQEVVDSITQNPDLAAAFMAQWGDHGGRPHKASFAMHALVYGCYLTSGAWYPVGGGKSFADHMIPTITQSGGEARAGVKVETLLVEDDRVVGVRTSDGEEISSDVVISNIGARETVNNLLPAGFGPKDWIAEIQSLPPSIAHFSLFLGFEGDVTQAGATRTNHWFYLYAERSCSMDPSDISKNMGVAFEAVGALIGTKGITRAKKPLSVYYGYDPQIMTFRAGFLVSKEDAEKAEGDVKADVLPAGKVLNYVHEGPYAKLSVSYDEAMKYISQNGMIVGEPIWEIYLNEPDDVETEDELKTDIYITVKDA